MSYDFKNTGSNSGADSSGKKTIQINPLTYILSSIILGGVISYFAFARPVEKKLSSKELFIEQQQIQLDSLRKTNHRIISERDSLNKQYEINMSVIKQDLAHTVLAANYYSQFQNSWFKAMNNGDFNGAEQLESQGFISLKLIQDMDDKYSVSTNMDYLFSFRKELENLEGK